jgi:hypothetical protein
MPRRSFVVACLYLAGLLASGVRPADAQTSADLFDPGTLQEIRLFINSKDLALLRGRYQENLRFPADLEWRNLRVRNVSLRSRGFGSRSGTKLGLLVEFDHYKTSQRFVGLSSLVLKNQTQDKSMIRERLAMAVFARMGLPASRESFGKVYINNEYQGLYGIVENIDASYLTRVFGDSRGFLYEYRWLTYYYATYLGDDLAAYKPVFEPRTRVLEADTTLYSPFRDLFREVNGPDDAVWRERVEQYLDLNYLVTYIAIENFMSEWDGFAGNYGMNNFFVHRPEGTTKLQILPWDRDSAMLDPNSSIFFHNDENVLVRLALSFSDLREQYLTVLENCARSVIEDDWFERQAADTSAFITDAAHEDARKPYTNEEFDAEVQFIKDYTRLRPAEVLNQVAKARASDAQFQRVLVLVTGVWRQDARTRGRSVY